MGDHAAQIRWDDVNGDGDNEARSVRQEKRTRSPKDAVTQNETGKVDSATQKHVHDSQEFFLHPISTQNGSFSRRKFLPHLPSILVKTDRERPDTFYSWQRTPEKGHPQNEDSDVFFWECLAATIGGKTRGNPAGSVGVLQMP